MLLEDKLLLDKLPLVELLLDDELELDEEELLLLELEDWLELDIELPLDSESPLDSEDPSLDNEECELCETLLLTSELESPLDCIELSLGSEGSEGREGFEGSDGSDGMEGSEGIDGSEGRLLLLDSEMLEPLARIFHTPIESATEWSAGL